MANAIGATGTHKRKETYADQVLTIARAETNLYEDFSTDYEKDEVTGQIMVPTRNGEVEVSDYDILNGIELKQSATDYLPLPIDKDYGINELIDGYEAEAVPDNVVAQRVESAGYSIGIKKENYAIDALKTGTVSADKTALTVTDVYKKIVAEVKNMKKRNMKVSSMRIAISADIEELLLTDEKFANSSSTLGAELLREGVIGKIAGVPVKTNYLMGTVGNDEIEFIIYDKRFCQRYEVWKAEPSVNNLADGKHIKASALQGRMVGGLKVTNVLGVQIKTIESIDILTVTSVASATTSGKTKITVAPELTAGRTYKYITNETVTTPTLDAVATGYTAWNGTAEITATTGHKINIVEVDANDKIKAVGQATVASKA